MFGYITTASTSTIVQTVSRCIVARSCAIGTASTVVASPRSKTVRASRSTPAGVVRSPDADGHHAGREQQHVAALDRLVLRPVHQLGPGEPRVRGVDRPGQRRLAHPGRHRQAGDGHPVADPDAGVAGEQQVRQRVDDEVVPVHEPVDQPADRSHLLVGQPGHQGGRQVGRVQPAQVGLDRAVQRLAEPRVAQHRGDRLVARRLRLQRRRPAGRPGTAPRRRGRAAARRTRRARPAPGRSTGCRRRAACRCCAASGASAPGPGRCSITVRRRPTSLSTPRAAGPRRWAGTWGSRPWPDRSRGSPSRPGLGRLGRMRRPAMLGLTAAVALARGVGPAGRDRSGRRRAARPAGGAHGSRVPAGSGLGLRHAGAPRRRPRAPGGAGQPAGWRRRSPLPTASSVARSPSYGRRPPVTAATRCATCTTRG